MAQGFMELFTHATQELINKSITIAQHFKNPLLVPLHILTATLDDEFCRSLFYALGIPLERLHALLEQELALLPEARGGR